MISTGGTLAEAADVLLDRGASRVMAYAVHPVLADDAPALIRNSNLERVVVTNTILVPPHCHDPKIEIRDIAWLIGEAIRRTHEGSSISALFQATRLRQELLV
jgi:ribose-phosphate pyrophosphokinase